MSSYEAQQVAEPTKKCPFDLQQRNDKNRLSQHATLNDISSSHLQHWKPLFHAACTCSNVAKVPFRISHTLTASEKLNEYLGLKEA